jgi:4-amino-4-deoxychorismate lyase
MTDSLPQTGAFRTLFRDGKVVRAELPAAEIGDGFYETFRTARGRPHLWSYHRQRLQHTCERAGVRVPATFLWHDEDRFLAVVRELLGANDAMDAVFRYALSTRPGADEAATAESLVPRALPPTAPPEGVTLRVLKVWRTPAEWVPRPKRLNCANVLEGRRELRTRAERPSDEGLFLSREDRSVVETANQNVAWVDGGCLHHPAPSTGCVAGTALAWLIDAGVRDVGLRSTPGCAQLDQLAKAEAVVVLNSVRGITPVAAVHGADDELLFRTPASAEHPQVRALQRLWRDELQRTASAA